MSATWRTIEDGLREEIVREVGRHRWRLWFRDTVVRDVGPEGITLAVPTEVHRTWLEYTYGPLLRRAAGQLLGEGTGVRLEVSEEQADRRIVRDRLPEDVHAWDRLLGARRPRPTLESFLPSGNDRFVPLFLGQLAHGHGPAAARTRAVYLYGEPGSGKSHLLRGLRRACEHRGPGEALYLTARRFTSMYVSALRARDLHAVRAFEVDLGHRRLVLLDDLHALARRPATQRALVRLREQSEGGGTRFVFASRVHPGDLEGFSGQLRSWLMDSVMLRLRTPDARGVREVLDARARHYGVELAEPVAAWIRERTGSVRGAVEVLDRWGAASAELGRPLEATWLPEIAPDVTTAATEEVVRRAKRVVTEHYGIPRESLDVATKARRVALPRRVAMYLVYRAAALPLAQLGRAFGLRSHSSVCRAIHQVRADRERDPALEQVIEGLLAKM